MSIDEPATDDDKGKRDLNICTECRLARDNQPYIHGFGLTVFPNGDIYEGNHINGRRHGVGMYRFKNGAKYYGEWKRGLKHGRGVLYYPDGSKYAGYWKRNKKHGYGSYYYSNGDVYEGSYFNNEQTGFGTYKYSQSGSTGGSRSDCAGEGLELVLADGRNKESSEPAFRTISVWRTNRVTPYREILPIIGNVDFYRPLTPDTLTEITEYLQNQYAETQEFFEWQPGYPFSINDARATFEEAIAATKFGKFNLLLILVIIPARWSSLFETTTMSYVFPAAQCDLGLTLDNKGLLNAITYAGMISSGFIWGFLVDSLGRKKLMYIGFFSDACFVLMSSLSQSFTQLLISKFLGGCIINGPFAALTSYVSEFHSAKYRARAQMVLGSINSLATLCLPLLAGLILPKERNFTIFNYFKMHSWNLFLLVATLPSFCGGIVFFLMPESPKFLMTNGRNDEALKVLRFVYRLNTGKPENTYPVQYLVLERKQRDVRTEAFENSPKRVLTQGLNQLKPLFIPPFVQGILLVCGLQMLIMMSLNTLRLWLPQLFQAIHDYEHLHNGTSASLCTMLGVLRPAPKNESNIPADCVVNIDNYEVYVNTMIVAIVTVCGFFLAGYLINKLGKKRLLFVLSMSGGFCGFGLYFAQSSNMTLMNAAIYNGLGSICSNITIAIVVDLFPTTLRTMAVSMTMMVGRFGAMLGNLLFPYLLAQGCAPPFFTIGAGIMSCAFIGILLPNTDMRALQ